MKITLAIPGSVTNMGQFMQISILWKKMKKKIARISMAELTIKLSQVNYLSLIIATTNCTPLFKIG